MKKIAVLVIYLLICSYSAGNYRVERGEQSSSSVMKSFSENAREANARSGDTVILKHTFYTSIFISSKHIPLLVVYELTREEVTPSIHLQRLNKFSADPMLRAATDLNNDYKGSHYDRGHNMSAEDNCFNSTAMNECFYFSNMFPQIHSLNAGVWKTLETEERKEAAQRNEIKVFVGSLGELKTIGADEVVVPAYCWKVIYTPSDDSYECYIFPNDKPESKDISHYEITLADLESRTHFTFLHDKVTINHKTF